MTDHCQIVELLTDHIAVLSFRILEQVFYQCIIGIEYQCSRGSEHRRIHSVHIVHLHHILHPAIFFGECDHRRNIYILQLLYLNLQLVIVQCFSEQGCQCIGLTLQFFFRYLFLHGICYICINTLEFNLLILSFQMADKRIINVILQNNCVHLLLTEHIDILALLYHVGHIVDRCLRSFFLFTVGLFICLLFRLFFCLVSFCFSVSRFLCFQVLVHSSIFTIQILEQHILHHTLTELLILDAAKFDERTDIIPVFLIILTVSLAHTA